LIAALIIVAVILSGILLMHFRKRWLAKFNIAVTNRITGLLAGWLPVSCDIATNATVLD